MVKATINNIDVEVPEGTSILFAARKAGFNIPTLCHHPDLVPGGQCGICIVEIEGMRDLKRSCLTPVMQGFKIRTHTPRIMQLRRHLVELILSDHDTDCLTCVKNNSCELQKLAATLGVNTLEYAPREKRLPIDRTSVSIVRDPNKCILCGRCTQVCSNIQTVHALAVNGRGCDTVITAAFDAGLGNSVCINCGQCVVHCPVGALYENSQIEKVWEALNDPDKFVVVQEAPAVRVMLGEEFGMPTGSLVSGKMHAALRRLNFDAVLDTNFAADLTIMEEGTEFLSRLKSGKNLPLITSCSPGWIKFMETFYHNMIPHMSTAKSPQQMFGALAKTYYADLKGIPAENIVSVSIMPCTAKKFECQRPEMKASGYQDVDYVLTTREIGRMMREAGLDLKEMPDELPDQMMGDYTGAATIFGATGGVMEAALRSAYYLATGKELQEPDIKQVRGLKGIKEAEIDVEGTKIKVAVTHSCGKARELLDKVSNQLEKEGKCEYQFIEVMACPGGCVGGGGQSWGSNMAKRARRGESLYKEDKSLPHRRSHQNPEVQALYDRFLGKPSSEKCHQLLHTHYFKRSTVDGKVIAEKEQTREDRNGR
ncbi:MAG TPA: NADH-dependent [FeFe] hydrogenase, group A6 [Syntrophorhabdaceae bacterium]|nr:NADH-dependent [FeFe] hydrogenase, group A6 [Syntrophorhabdaceae bacterium]